MSLAVIGIGAGIGLCLETAGRVRRRTAAEENLTNPDKSGAGLTLSGKMLQLFPAALFLGLKAFGFAQQRDWMMTTAATIGATGIVAVGMGLPVAKAWAKEDEKAKTENSASTVAKHLKVPELAVDFVTKGINFAVVLTYAIDLNALGTRASKAFGLGLGLSGLGLSLVPPVLAHLSGSAPEKSGDSSTV